jgi:hypothetical protein
VSRVATDFWPEVAGIALEDIAPNGSGIMGKFGFMSVLVQGPISIGDLVLAGVIGSEGFARGSSILAPDSNFEMNITFGQNFASAYASGFSGLATILVTI